MRISPERRRVRRWLVDTIACSNAALDARLAMASALASARRLEARTAGLAVILFAVLACFDEAPRPTAPASPLRAGAVPSLALTGTADTTVLAADAFSRVVDRGWGTAELGGAWSFNSSDLSMVRVSGTQGLVVTPNTTARALTLKQLQLLDASGLLAFSVDRVPDGLKRAHAVEVYARRRNGTGGENWYRLRVRGLGNGTMDVRAEMSLNGVTTVIRDVVVIPVIWVPGARYWVRWDCMGTSPATTIRMRVWRDGSAEPEGWQLAAAVDQPALDVAGNFTLRVTPPTSEQVNWPVTFAFDDFKLFTHTSSANMAPVADAGGPYLGMASHAVPFDASHSTDADNDVPLRFHWDFGDGMTSDEATPNHVYAGPGVYTVTVTATDTRGLSSEPVTTSATIDPYDPMVLIRDRFHRDAVNGWGSAELGGGPWQIDLGVRPAFSVNGAEGKVALPDVNPRNVIATTGYGMNVEGITSFSIDRRPDDPGRFHTVQVYARRDDRVGDGDFYYRYRLRLFGNGLIEGRLEKEVNTVGGFVSDTKKLTLGFVPGQKYWFRWECVGTSPTTLIRARLWADGTPEPTTWDLEGVSNEPALDVIGTTGFRVQVASSNQVTFPVTFTFDDLVYRLK